MTERLDADDGRTDSTTPTETVTVEVLYTRGAESRDADRLEEGSEAFHLSRTFRAMAAEAFDEVDADFAHVLDVAYVSLFEAEAVELEHRAGRGDVEALAESLYQRLQGPRRDDVLGYDGERHRSATTGDIFNIDGTAVLIDTWGTEVLGEMAALRDSATPEVST